MFNPNLLHTKHIVTSSHLFINPFIWIWPNPSGSKRLFFVWDTYLPKYAPRLKMWTYVLRWSFWHSHPLIIDILHFQDHDILHYKKIESISYAQIWLTAIGHIFWIYEFLHDCIAQQKYFAHYTNRYISPFINKPFFSFFFLFGTHICQTML